MSPRITMRHGAGPRLPVRPLVRAVLVVCLASIWFGGFTRADEFLNPPGQPLPRARRDFLRRELLGRRAGAPDFLARHRAVLDLAAAGRAAVADIVMFVDGPDSVPLNRRVAIFSLGLLGEPSSAVHLSRWASDSKKTVAERIAAAWSLGFYGDGPSERVLRSLVEESTDNLLRRVALLSLARRGATAAIPLILSCVDSARESSGRIRATGVLALGILRDLSGRIALLSALHDKDALVREAAVWALAASKGDGLPRGPGQTRVMPDGIEGTYALALGLSRVEGAVEQLLGMVRSGGEAGADALFSAARMGGEALEVIAEALREGRSSEMVFASLLAAASSSEPERFAPAILGWLSSGRKEVLSAAALAMGALGANAAGVRGLVRVALDAEAPLEARRDALLSLGGWGQGRLPDDLERTLHGLDESLTVTLAQVRAVSLRRVSPVVLREAREQRLVALRARFEYRFGAARDRLIRAALELDANLGPWRGEKRVRESGASGSVDRQGATRGPVPEPPASGKRTGSASTPSGRGSHQTQSGTGGRSGNGGATPRPPSGQRDGQKSTAKQDRSGLLQGGRRQGVFRPELVEHDLRLLLQGGFWFPHAWPTRDS